MQSIPILPTSRDWSSSFATTRQASSSHEAWIADVVSSSTIEKKLPSRDPPPILLSPPLSFPYGLFWIPFYPPSCLGSPNELTWGWFTVRPPPPLPSTGMQSKRSIDRRRRVAPPAPPLPTTGKNRNERGTRTKRRETERRTRKMRKRIGVLALIVEYMEWKNEPYRVCESHQPHHERRRGKKRCVCVCAMY